MKLLRPDSAMNSHIRNAITRLVCLLLWAGSCFGANIPETLDWSEPPANSALLINREYPLRARTSSGRPFSVRIHGPAIYTNGSVVATGTGQINVVVDLPWAGRGAARTFFGAEAELESLGQWPPIVRAAYAVTVVDHWAYLSHGPLGLTVINVADPTRPVPLATFPSRSVFFLGAAADYQTPEAMEVGGWLYLRSSVGQYLTAVRLADARWLGPRVQLGRKAAKPAPTFAPLYSVDSTRIVVQDGSVPSDAVELGNLEVSFPYRENPSNSMLSGIAFRGRFAFVGDEIGPLRTISLSAPTNPHIASVSHQLDGLTVHGFSGSQLLAGGPRHLRVISVDDPLAPAEIGRIEFPEETIEQVAFEGERALIALRTADRTTNRLVSLDLSEPSQPRIANELFRASPGTFHKVGHRLFQISENFSKGPSLVISDISASDELVDLARLDLRGSATDVALIGSFALVADGANGLVTLDLTDPRHPVEVGHFETYPDRCWRFQLEGDVAYVPVGEGEIRILDVSDPPNLRVRGNLPVPVVSPTSSATLYALSRNVAMVTDGNRRLRVLDTSDPANLVEVGSFEAETRITNVRLVEHTALLDLVGIRWIVLDVSVPSRPRALGALQEGWKAEGIVRGEHIYRHDMFSETVQRWPLKTTVPVGGQTVFDSAFFDLVETGNSILFGRSSYSMGVDLSVVNVERPEAPRLAARFNLGEFAPYGLAIDQELLVVAGGAAGVKTCRLRQGPRILTEYFSPGETGELRFRVSPGGAAKLSVQSSADLQNWKTLGDYVPTPGPLELPAGPAGEARFFRVVPH